MPARRAEPGRARGAKGKTEGRRAKGPKGKGRGRAREHPGARLARALAAPPEPAPAPAPPRRPRRVADLVTVEDRVRYIIRRMARARWRVTDAERLARVWGCDASTVRRCAAEASRYFRVAPEERDAARAELAAWFRGVAEGALRMVNEVTGLPDFKAALDAMSRYGEYTGLGPIVAPEEPPPAPPEPPRIVIVLEEPPCRPPPTVPKAEQPPTSG